MDEYPVICMKCGVRGKISGSVLASVDDPSCPGCGSTDIDLDDGDRSHLAKLDPAEEEKYIRAEEEDLVPEVDRKSQNELAYLLAEEEDIHRQAIVDDILKTNPDIPREAAVKLATRVSTRYLAASKDFDEWMKDVDDAVAKKVGLSVHDLEDQPFMDWYEDGVSAASAARRALQYSGGDF